MSSSKHGMMLSRLHVRDKTALQISLARFNATCMLSHDCSKLWQEMCQKLGWRLPAHQDACIKTLHSNALIPKVYQATSAQKCLTEAVKQLLEGRVLIVVLPS